MARVLIAGCGYMGGALAARLLADRHTVSGLRRRADRLPPGVQPIAADLTVPATLHDLPVGLDIIVYCAGADASDAASYRAAYVDGVHNLLDALVRQGQRPSRILLTSSTGVYAQSDGEWVDESSETAPSDPTGRLLLEGERKLLAGPFPAVVVRLAGIYGPGRTRLVERARRGEATSGDGPSRFVNRIHRDDCVGALAHLMALPAPAPLYVAADHEPADERTVLRWLAAELGVPAPRGEARAAEGRRARGHKRCRNTRLVESGYRFAYPTFREGYRALLAG